MKSSFTYDGPQNVLCTPAPMSGDVRIQPTPEPTPNCPLDTSAFIRSRKPTIASAHRFNESDQGYREKESKDFRPPPS